MKTIVIYKSRTGFTKQYAEWIGEALSCEVVEFSKMNTLNLNDFDMVIYGGRVHAGKIECLNKVKALFEKKSCKLVVFATGATPMDAKDTIDQMMAANFSDDSIPHFYMQSGLCYEKMGVADKLIMKMLSKMLAGKKDKSDTEKGTANAISQSHDISSKKYITPLVEYVQNYVK